MTKKLILLSVLFSILLGGCFGNGDDSFIEESGTIETTNIVISSRATGEIIELNADEGDKKNSGDTLLIIDNELPQIQQRQAEAALAAAEASYDLLKKGARSEDIRQAEEALKQARSGYELAEKDKNRMEKLYNSGSVTKKLYDDTFTRFTISEAQFRAAEENLKKIRNIARPEELRAAEAKVKQAEAQVDLLKKSISDCFVTAPMTGEILEKYVEKGETVTRLSSLFKMADPSVVKLVIYVSETNLGKIKTGQKAEITTDTWKDKVYKGEVIHIASEAQFTPQKYSD